MADISISVNGKQSTITLDKWEWTGLTVNGIPAKKYHGPNPNIQFQETEDLVIHFTAIANHYIDLVNPGTTEFLKDSDDSSTYMLVISYQEKNSIVTLNGTIIRLPYGIPTAKLGPILFSQGRMTGSFQVG
jgi:hypothetical protein